MGNGSICACPSAATGRPGRACAPAPAVFSNRGSRAGRPTRSPGLSFRARVARYAEDWRTDQAYNFFVFADDDALVGGIGLSNVRRGVSETASLGYWVGEPYARQGYMSAALPLVLDFSFERLRLHRVEAACLPTNIPSRALLTRAGFHHEGHARQYLCIEGKWQDHLLFAMLSGDWRKPGA